MTVQRTYYNAAGRILGYTDGSIEEVDAGRPPDCIGTVEGIHRASTHYVRDELEVVERPVVAAPLLTGQELDLSSLPPEAVVTLTNEDGASAELMAADGPVTLADPGAYGVRIKPPFPWLPLSILVDVS